TKKKEAATKIKSVFRGHEAKAEFAKKKAAATKIQSIFRVNKARDEVAEIRLKTRKSIQYRGLLKPNRLLKKRQDFYAWREKRGYPVDSTTESQLDKRPTRLQKIFYAWREKRKNLESNKT
ncbi:MAG: hypothetical protein P8P83_01930, partial [Rickettsiaceae bacterium]|nr:hypothetical protein [Rickettsiaceae bacterium]